MPERSSAPRGPARRHDRTRPTGARNDGHGARAAREAPGARTARRRSGARAASTHVPTTTALRPGTTGRGVAPGTRTGGTARVLDRAGELPITVWLLDPPDTATADGLRERLRHALTDTTAASTAAADPATADLAPPGPTGAPVATSARRVSDGSSPHPSTGAGNGPQRDGLADRSGPRDRDPHEDGNRSAHDAEPDQQLGGSRPPVRCTAADSGHRSRSSARPEAGEGAFPHRAPAAIDPVAETARAEAPPAVDPFAASTAVPGAAPGAGTDVAAAPARCVLLDAGRGPVTEAALSAAGADLGPRDVLAVVTVSQHDGGVLHDPRPALVTTAAAVGLEHRQHIVTITRHRDTRPRNPRPRNARPRDTGPVRWELGPDLSLFARPQLFHTRSGAAHDHPTDPTDARPEPGSAVGRGPR